jgi:plasmid replication initiation protein
VVNLKKKDYSQFTYSNDITININDFSPYELDVLLCLIYVSRTIMDNINITNEKNLVVKVPAINVKKYLEGSIHNARIKKALLNIFNMKVFFKDDDYTEVHHVFEKLVYSQDCKNIEFELKKEYISLFYDLTKNFTKHEINEFTKLSSKYAKRIYQLIMSNKNLGFKQFTTEQFKKILNIPDVYKWCNIDSKVISIAKKELLENTDITHFELVKEKCGKQIVGVTLMWSFKQEPIGVETEIQNTEKNSENSIMEDVYENYKRLPEDIQQIIEKKAFEYFIEKSGFQDGTTASKTVWNITKKAYIIKVITGEIS